MVYRIDGVEVIAEQVTEGNLKSSQALGLAAQVGDVVVTYGDRRVEVMTKEAFDEVAVSSD